MVRSAAAEGANIILLQVRGKKGGAYQRFLRGDAGGRARVAGNRSVGACERARPSASSLTPFCSDTRITAIAGAV